MLFTSVFGCSLFCLSAGSRRQQEIEPRTICIQFFFCKHVKHYFTMASAQEKEVVIKKVPKTSSEKRLIVILEKASLESVKVWLYKWVFRECHVFSRFTCVLRQTEHLGRTWFFFFFVLTIILNQSNLIISSEDSSMVEERQGIQFYRD